MVRQQRIVRENVLFTYLPKRDWTKERQSTVHGHMPISITIAH